MRPRPTMTFLCANNVACALLHFYNVTLYALGVCKLFTVQTHLSLFSLLDGHAISFNSPAKFARKKKERARRRVATRVARQFAPYGRRGSWISGVIYSRLHAIAFRRNFSYVRVLSPWHWRQYKNNEPYPAPAAVARIS